MLKTTLITLGFFVSAFSGHLSAQNHSYKFKISGAGDSTIFLANYYGNKLYYNDTAKADSKGFVQFGKKKTEAGMYAVVANGKYFDVVINNEDISMESDITDMQGKVAVKKSVENKLFYDYVNFLTSKRKDIEASKTDKAKSAQIDNEVKTYQKKLIAENPASLTAKYINLGRDIEIPEQPKNADGSPVDSLWAYKYLYKHYFDHLDFSDDRMVRSPFFQNRVESFFKNMVVQVPDSMVSALAYLLPKFEASKEQFKMVCQKMAYETSNSKQMCMDKAFVHIVQNYHKKGKVTWLTDKQLKDIIERGDEMAPCVCDITATPITLPDSAMKWHSLYNLNTEYTVLIFWSPDCGHCKKAMPEFVSMMKKFKGKSVSLYSVSQEHTPEWKKFIRTNHMEDFVNVAVPMEVYQKDNPVAHQYVQQGLTDYNSLNYRKFYDIITTPRIYLLDKNKTIVAKHVEAEQMEKLLNILLEKKNK